jgi:hypothetical protein
MIFNGWSIFITKRPAFHNSSTTNVKLLGSKKKKKNILKRCIRFKRMTWNTFQEKNSTMQTFQPSWAQKQNIGKHFCLFVASCDPNAFF